MKARPILHEKLAFGSGIVEIVLWQLASPLPPAEHEFKYRLVYVVDGLRLVGYDNERGKGDHKHFDGVERAYEFIDAATLLVDFWEDVKRAKR